MTMEVEPSPGTADEAEIVDRDKILDHLSNNDTIYFKSQQRGESDLTKQERTAIALEIYEKSKFNFLSRFGKYLRLDHLNFFQQFATHNVESYEINLILKDLTETCRKNHVIVKNRRYQALQEMIDGNSYFSEIEMMKRNPLLYQQLVGQYLTDEEKRVRDKIVIDDSATLVKVLMEGIERDNAELKRKDQENHEDEVMEEEEISDEDNEPEPSTSYRRWGEFEEDNKIIKIEKKPAPITVEEQEILKEEFVTSMYQSFLDGKDDDFDYVQVDENEKYDNIKDEDDEEKYFDSEEPELAPPCEVESEDELDIFMSAINPNPAVAQLSKDMKNL